MTYQSQGNFLKILFSIIFSKFFTNPSRGLLCLVPVQGFLYQFYSATRVNSWDFWSRFLFLNPCNSSDGGDASKSLRRGFQPMPMYIASRANYFLSATCICASSTRIFFLSCGSIRDFNPLTHGFLCTYDVEFSSSCLGFQIPSVYVWRPVIFSGSADFFP